MVADESQRPRRSPVRVAITEFLYALKVGHEARQIREITPEGIKLGAGTGDMHGLLDVNALFVRHADIRVVVGNSSIHAECPIQRRLPCQAAIGQLPRNDTEQEPRKSAAP